MKKKLEEFIGTVTEIKTMENQLLAYAKIAYVIEEEEKVTIELIPNREDDYLPLIKYNTPIKIMVQKEENFMALGGTVYISDKEYWKVTNIKEYQNFERRGYFRVSATAPGEINKLVEDGSEEKSYPVQLIDISLSGVLFAADEIYSEKETLILHSQIKNDEGTPLHLRCKVVAKEETVNLQYLYKYRCKFEENSSATADNLCKIIFKLERENIKKMKSKNI